MLINTPINARILFDARALLGEGAIWDHLLKRLYWVDIEGMCFNVFNPATLENKTYNTEKRIGSVVPINSNAVLVALEDGLAIINLTNGAIEYKCKTQIHLTHNKRFNDGKCDPNGRFWVGTLSMDDIREVSALYCVKDDFTLEEKITGVSISNGIVWNADGSLMYYIDTPTGEIVQYDFEGKSGHISNKKLVVKIPEEIGYPDGMTIDIDGMLWVALWDGFGVVKINPFTGQLLQKVDLPVPKVTSCAFGGENLDTLFITTARTQMSEKELEDYPLSGAIFTANVNTKGLPAFNFNL